MLSALISVLLFHSWWIGVLFTFVLSQIQRTFIAGVNKIHRHQHYPRHAGRKKYSAVVVVGGDFARSPRMQYHAVSLANAKMTTPNDTSSSPSSVPVFEGGVNCVGLQQGNKACEDIVRLEKEGRVNLGFLVAAPTLPFGFMAKNWILRTLYRVLYFAFFFFAALFSACHARSGNCPTVVLVQTPPAVPFLPLLQLVLLLENSYRWYQNLGKKPSDPSFNPPLHLWIDFHNFGYSLLQVDKRHKLIVSLYKTIEWAFARADRYLTVAEAMKNELSSPRWNIPKDKITVLHDLAPSFFGPFSSERFRDEILPLEPQLVDPNDTGKGGLGGVPSWFGAKKSCTGKNNKNSYTFMSSTSWTSDDDYGLVVDAFKMLDDILVGRNKTFAEAKEAPFRVWLIVSGKGETKQRFEQQVAEANFSGFTRVTTAYFQSFQHYANMLGSADCGLCVHRSSSGFDLPMKCVDMFGCHLPVVALNYPALPELVTHNETGWTFDDELSLLKVLKMLVVAPGAQGRELLRAAKEKVVARQQRSGTWQGNWDAKVHPMLM